MDYLAYGFFGTMISNASGLRLKMASTFYAMSSVGSFATPSSCAMDKKFLNSSETLSSLAYMSSSSVRSRIRNVVMQKRYSPVIRAMAKELHFNKDGYAVKKLQVRLQIVT